MVGALFIRPMFDAIVKGIKTKTSRFSEKQTWQVGQVLYIKEPVYLWGIIGAAPAPKDIIWSELDLSYTGVTYGYDAELPPGDENVFWRYKPKLFCPMAAARHFIKITKAERRRLGDMQLADYLAEGITKTFALEIESGKTGVQFHAHITPFEIFSSDDPLEVFKFILKLTDKKYKYDPNQLVWVYDFEKNGFNTPLKK